MSLESIIRNRKGRAGSGGSWRVERSDSDPFVGQDYELWHYGTCMLQWTENSRGEILRCKTSTGHGSVSDQHGMNTAFRVLGLDLYYSRKGGAEIS